MKNFVYLSKNEMKMVLGGIERVELGDGSCTVSHSCSSTTSIGCSGEVGTCVVNSTEHWVSCDGARTNCN